MSDAKFTSGPWIIRPYKDYDKRIVIADAARNFAADPIAWVDNDDVPKDEGEANARLIAAAPYLLAACKHTLAIWDKISLNENVSPSQLIGAIKMVGDAIALATKGTK